MEGLILKGIGGFYYVKSGNNIIECKARGKFRNKNLVPLVGDKVKINYENGKGIIEDIYERDSELIRPAVANVTQAIIVFTVKEPDINSDLINKFILQCEYKNLKIVICFNKIDLLSNYKYHPVVKMILDAGYDVIFTNAKKNVGLDQIKNKINGEISVICGPSGVGKSTILNELIGYSLMEVGDVSNKLGRGKHTTRHSEIVEAYGGFIVDTPGFSSVSIDYLASEELKYYFPEFNNYNHKCKFRGCLHYKEPNCIVKELVEKGIINKMRYDFYTNVLNELLTRRTNK